MTEQSNLGVAPNVMLVDREGSSSEMKYLPGDLAVAVYGRTLMGSKALIAKLLTEAQLVEFRQYLVCAICGKTCAGTCQRPTKD